MGLVGPENLKRRDRTRGDCGYYITHENGWLTIHEFASKEECQAFVASLTNAATRLELSKLRHLCSLSWKLIHRRVAKRASIERGRRRGGDSLVFETLSTEAVMCGLNDQIDFNISMQGYKEGLIPRRSMHLH